MLTAWTTMLEDLSSAPLALREDFPEVAARHEAWWQGRNERVVVLAQRVDPGRAMTRRLELLEDPAAWMAAKLADLAATQWLGDALPHVRVDFGPVLLGALLGGQSEIGHDTTWTHPLINDDWANEPDWQLRTDHPWWARLAQLLERVADDARGRYLVMTPDLGGSCDVLLNLRGSEPLCMDVFEQPQRITAALTAMEEAWWQTWTALYQSVLPHGAGLMHWLGIWSQVPYVVPACDFNALIGPEAFGQLCLPDIRRQAARAQRAVFHLDGPDAARHIDALLQAPEIQAIQFTPGQGTPSTRPWVDMFRRIRQAGRSLYVICPVEEAADLVQAVGPQGLMLRLEGVTHDGQIQRLLAQTH